MKALRILLPTLVISLCVPITSDLQAQNTPNNQNEEDDNAAKESDGHRRFWQASLPGGHYMVALDRISNISMHEYVLDGNVVVNEVTIDTTGRALARFYYLEPLSESMKRNEVTRVVDRGRELLDRAGQRLGTEAHNMAQKNYPTTTHAGMIEYRILDIRNLDALYNSVRKAWESGKGRKLTIK
ncbi:MAG: hypothetical protein ACPG4K_05990, partial [Haloferula sp.]